MSDDDEPDCGYTPGALGAYYSGDGGGALVAPAPAKRKKVADGGGGGGKGARPPPQNEDEGGDGPTPASARASAAEPSAGPETATAGGFKRRMRDNAAKRAAGGENERTLYLGNLPPDVTVKQVRRLCAGHGHIASVRLRSGVPKEPHGTRKAAIITRDFAAGLQSLCAYVKFDAAAPVAEAAGALNGAEHLGRRLRADHARDGPAVYPPKSTVFVGNLPYGASDDALWSHFEHRCGSVRTVRIVRDRHTGAAKGFAFVVFEERSSVAPALRLDGGELAGRPLRVTRCGNRAEATGGGAQQQKPQRGKGRADAHAAPDAVYGGKKGAPPKGAQRAIKMRRRKRDKANAKLLT